ncbi:hypothetical protein D3C75_1257560 [compost metagenome]
MGAQHARYRTGQLHHLFADRFGQFLVHQGGCAFAGDLHGTPENVEGDCQAEPGIELRPAEVRQQQGHQNTGVEQQVGAVMQ